MTEYMTEQEQIQQLKNWIKQYGLTILLGIVLALVITSGWHYYQGYKENKLIHASSVYDQMLSLRAQNNSNRAVVQAQKLLKNYPHTPYAQMAALMLARDATLKKNYPEAIQQLNWVIDHSKDKAIREIARLRIARVLITEKKPQEALDTLSKINDNNFNGFADEIRGDAYLALHDTNSARKAYEQALQELPNAEVTRPILQMKLDNLAT
ncbi:MAG TPA: tetratricopeptide repeat protein [Candidatus Babeliaceae bacterium]|nr:tetratricopeptide repeat protein [Candidatus Babeliaceae bacterium]